MDPILPSITSPKSSPQHNPGRALLKACQCIKATPVVLTYTSWVRCSPAKLCQKHGSLYEGLRANPTFAVLCSFVTAMFFLGMYFLPAAVIVTGGVKQVTTLP